jgi:hypothetical protein
MIDYSQLKFAKPQRRTKEKIQKPRKVAVEQNPLEAMEQETVAQWLDLHKVFYNISISGAFLHPATFNRLKRMGYKRGLPDVIIFDPPPAYNGKFKGVALEMKRRKGGIVSDEQRTWLEKLANLGWLSYVARGADEAIEILETCGYGRKS